MCHSFEKNQFSAGVCVTHSEARALAEEYLQKMGLGVQGEQF